MVIPAIIEENKNLFAPYLTMALMNVQTVLDHIRKTVGIKQEFPRGEYIDQKTGKKCKEGPEDFWCHDVITFLKQEKVSIPEQKIEIENRLFRNFPFLKIMAENQREYNKRNEINSNDIHYPLEQCFRVLKKYRDFTCHAFIEDNSWDEGSKFFLKNEQPLSIIIDNYYTIALRNVADRYKYDSSKLDFIQKKRKTRVDKKWITDETFFLTIQHRNGDTTGKFHLSGVGVATLICLFLEKKYINEFLSKLNIYGMYRAGSEEARIIRRSMAINSINLPKERITSEKGDMSIALDMLNELKRCPKELFDTLSWENQNRFRIVSSDYNEVIQMRSSDRFAQLSLQYIDYNRLFEKIRFHVNMGKLRYLVAPDKLCIDNSMRVRVLEHTLNGYGRVDEMEEFRKQSDGTYGDSKIEIRDFENVIRDDRNPENYPYIVDSATRYLLNNNKIEFRFGDQKPVIKSKNGKWSVEKKEPTCRMSVLELPAMMFHIHLLGERKTECRIEEVYNKYKRLFQAMSEGRLTVENIDDFGIARADMPKKVIDAINGVTAGKNYSAFVAKELKSMLEETNRQIESLKLDIRAVDSSDNKMGKRGFRQIKPGKIADFLAQDIVKFQPSLCSGEGYGTDKITGMNYRVMQATIATYSSFDDLYNMFVKAHLVGGKRERNHPFLYHALKHRHQNVVDFYKSYLYAKKKYIDGLQQEISDGKKVVLPFVQKDGKKWLKRNSEYYRIMGDIYNEDIPIELPRQMFDEDIKQELKKKSEMEGIDFDNANVTYLIAEYLKRVHKDDFQAFYEWKRNYRYIDMLQCKTDSKNSLKKTYTTTYEREKIWENRSEHLASYNKWARDKKKKDRAMQRMKDAEFDALIDKRVSICRNYYQKDEKVIRRYKVQDALMYFMVLDAMTKNLKFDASEFKLRDVMPDAEKGILSKVMPITFKFEKGNKKYTIHSEGMKLKNYGEFYALAHDKRLPSLIDIIGTHEVNKEVIERELDNYDTNRPEIMTLVLDFERMAFDKYPTLKYEAEEHKHFDFLALLDYLSTKHDINSDQKEVLRQIRNAFSHNIYPRKGIVEITTLPEIANHLKEIFGRYAQMEK